MKGEAAVGSMFRYHGPKKYHLLVGEHLFMVLNYHRTIPMADGKDIHFYDLLDMTDNKRFDEWGITGEFVIDNKWEFLA